MPSCRPAVVICGGGVIGAATAYYLSLRDLAPTVVEREAIACAASGKSGGFLALDWCDGSALQPLARLSFSLHAQLSEELASDYGYRRLTTLAVTAGTEPSSAPAGLPDWLDGGHVTAAAPLGDTATTAQVHPAQFTRALLDAACRRGARVVRGAVEDILSSDGRVSAVRVDGQSLAADAAVIAAGPWSGRVAPSLPLPPVYGLKGHSIVLRPSREVPAQALFVDYHSGRGRLSPEIYPRPDGTVYLCGLSENQPVPEHPQQVRPRADAGATLQSIAASVSTALAGLRPEQWQACYRPVVADALPLLGEVPGVAGAYIATGHNCWGILNAPASGLALAELITRGRSVSLDLAAFSPSRLV